MKSPENTTIWLWRVIIAGVFLAPLIGIGIHAGARAWFYPELLPETWSLDPLLRQLSNPATSQALIRSLVIALSVTLIALVISVPAAQTLGTMQFRGRSLVLLLLFLPNVVPPLASGMGLTIVFLRLGLDGSLFAVIFVHLIPVVPYVVFALLGVFARLDPGYQHMARSLGATETQIFWRVTLPLITPGVVVAGLFGFLISWSQYILTLLIGSGQVITLPVLLFSAVAGGNPTTIASLALIFAAPPLLAVILAARWLTRPGAEWSYQNQ